MYLHMYIVLDSLALDVIIQQVQPFALSLVKSYHLWIGEIAWLLFSTI